MEENKKIYRKPDGKMIAEIGEERKWLFKSALSKRRTNFTTWLKEMADKFIKEVGVG